MSWVMAMPGLVAEAADELAGLASTLDAAHSAAAAPTTALVPAAADEVSAMVANVFSRHAAGFQEGCARASAFLDQQVRALRAAAAGYAATEAAKVP